MPSRRSARQSSESPDPAIALRQRVARGDEAQRLLADPLFEAALDAIEEDAIEAWRSSSGPAGIGTREAAHATVRGIDQIRGQIRAWFDDGEFARAELAELTDQPVLEE